MQSGESLDDGNTNKPTRVGNSALWSKNNCQRTKKSTDCRICVGEDSLVWMDGAASNFQQQILLRAAMAMLYPMIWTFCCSLAGVSVGMKIESNFLNKEEYSIATKWNRTEKRKGRIEGKELGLRLWILDSSTLPAYHPLASHDGTSKPTLLNFIAVPSPLIFFLTHTYPHTHTSTK